MAIVAFSPALGPFIVVAVWIICVLNALIIFALAIALTTLLIFVSYKLFKRRRGAAIPGPQAWPLVGNILQLPESKEWETYEKWAKAYGM